MRFALFVFTTLTALAFITSLAKAEDSANQVQQTALQVINVLHPSKSEEIQLQVGVPVLLKFEKMGGQRVSVSATHYPILVKASEIPADAYLSHYFFCPLQTMANDPANSKIWLASADPANRHDATHTWLQLNRKGEVIVTLTTRDVGRVRPGFTYSLPTDERDRVYLNFLHRTQTKFVTWNPNMYDYENLLRDNSKDNLSAMQRARPGNIGGQGCAQPQISISARIRP